MNSETREQLSRRPRREANLAWLDSLPDVPALCDEIRTTTEIEFCHALNDHAEVLRRRIIKAIEALHCAGAPRVGDEIYNEAIANAVNAATNAE